MRREMQNTGYGFLRGRPDTARAWGGVSAWSGSHSSYPGALALFPSSLCPRARTLPTCANPAPSCFPSRAYVLVLKVAQDVDLAQRPLAVGHVVERLGDLFDRDLAAVHRVRRRASMARARACVSQIRPRDEARARARGVQGARRRTTRHRRRPVRSA